jgi:hypothetical protein
MIQRHLLHLDAVLGAVVAQGMKLSDEDFAARLPIVMKDGIYRCSAAFWVGPALTQTVKFQSSIQKSDDREAWLERLEKTNCAMSSAESKFRPVLSSYEALLLQHVDFLADVPVGRMAEFIKVCRAVPGLGKKVRSGFGAISDVKISHYDGDVWLLPGVEATVSRALPVAVWDDHRCKAAVCHAFEAAKPPYSDSGRVLCVRPPRADALALAYTFPDIIVREIA